MNQNKAMVFSIAWHLLRDRGAAEELAQDVFLQLYRSWNSLESEAHVTFWLRKVTTHRAIDQARKRQRHGEIALEDDVRPMFAEPKRDALLSGYLRRLVASLPEKQRAVVVLRYGEDMDVDEIARTLGIKAATVKTQLWRALELLRTKAGDRLGKRAIQ